MSRNSAQPGLFHETLEEALSEAILSLGPRKSLALDLWPSKTEREAHNRLDACLNPARDEKFDSSEIVMLLRRAREVGCHVAMRFLCAQAGYAEPVPMSPEDEHERLQREFVDAAQTLARISKALGLDHKLPAAMRVIK